MPDTIPTVPYDFVLPEGHQWKDLPWSHLRETIHEALPHADRLSIKLLPDGSILVKRCPEAAEREADWLVCRSGEPGPYEVAAKFAADKLAEDSRYMVGAAGIDGMTLRLTPEHV